MSLDHLTVRSAAATVVACSLLALGGCGSADSPEPFVAAAENNDPLGDGVGYSGWYVEEFASQVGSYDGDDVTVSGEVGQVLSDHSFTLTNPAGATVVPLLVVSGDDVTELAAGDLISVSGEVNADFTVADADEELDVELDPSRHAAWRNQPYVLASNTSTP
jgi:hypothetical protein